MSRPQRHNDGEVSDTQQHPVSSRGSKVPSEKVALLVLSALLAATVVVICQLSLALVRTNERFQTLRDDSDAVKRNTDGSCWKCEDGWERHGEKCYSFSTTKSTWNKSRDECSGGRGDLVKINSTEQQTFLDMRLRDKMTDAEDKFWIGLTDSESEGTWLWADGSPLNPSLVFWSNDEPDNWDGDNPDGEDCVRMGERRGTVEHKSWFDKACEIPHKYICEKPAETREIN
ncbi:hepatic lectin-like [Labrus mixtus]|uniref:hepatic lectin-like n=1 Tax=Labrus mixtus TaxID=508554 RepID=UPI0029C0D680|nr:hepatic lectin-like [Labrus mixtus]